MSNGTDLLTLGNPKTAKGEARGWYTAVLHLAPYNLSGRNVCPFASAGCAAACLNTAGRGGILKAGESTNAIQEARKRRTREFFSNRQAFVARLLEDIRRHVKRSAREGMKAAIRLNGTSDISWEGVAPEIFAAFPDVQFYDYTKSVARTLAFLAGKMPRNYHLTFSRSESNEAECRKVLRAGGNVAVVFASAEMPQRWNGAPVVNADEHDLRFLDPRGAVAGLKAKGKAKRDTSGFVVR